jgi:hypothetical protein
MSAIEQDAAGMSNAQPFLGPLQPTLLLLLKELESLHAMHQWKVVLNRLLCAVGTVSVGLLAAEYAREALNVQWVVIIISLTWIAEMWRYGTRGKRLEEAIVRLDHTSQLNTYIKWKWDEGPSTFSWWSDAIAEPVLWLLFSSLLNYTSKAW